MTNLGILGWPVGVAGGWGQVPQNLMPKRTQAWPRGTQRAANDAERLLSTAVGWWDAAYYTPGDRFLRNRGVAGELLDMRLGSSSSVATSNDPLFLAPGEVGYCYLPGVANNYLSVPDEATLDITGDIDIRVCMALDDWTPAQEFSPLMKWATSNFSYALSIATTGRPILYWSATGSAALSATATVAPNVADGAGLWVRTTLDVDNGSSGRTITFYTSRDGSAWTQLGDPVVQANVTSVFSGNAALNVGADLVNSRFMSGRIYRAIVKDGIDGTTVLDVDCDALTSGSATSFTAATGQTVTINRATSGRKTVAQPARGRGGRALFLLGTDDYMEVQDNWQHQLLNFGQGDSFTVMFCGRQWATPVTNGPWIGKTVTSPFTGHLLSQAGSNANRYAAEIGDGLITSGASSALDTYSYNSIAVLGYSVDRAARRLIRYSNGTATRTSTITDLGSLYNTIPLRIGRRPDGNVYQDFEFTAAAVLRRALSASEIKLISDYYATRGF